uniref:Uncharacterized protein n=1 Tax=Anguilla anguilla TaxID=7936 RepID=A0A0E9T952_ANGAN
MMLPTCRAIVVQCYRFTRKKISKVCLYCTTVQSAND